MTTAKKALLALALMASCGTPKTVSETVTDPEIEAANALAERVVPSYSDNIKFEHLPDTLEAYELESVGDFVVIRGSSALSMAVGLNRYLSDYCLTDVSWYASHEVKVPSEMPAVPKKVRSESVLPERFFLNYCTFGYTMPWWKWEDWERFIDWMALNGVTMPLAITDPAHLPWHRMCNIDGVDGPLPQGWIDGQVELQKMILERERSFGMKPVPPAFDGQEPEQLGFEVNPWIDEYVLDRAWDSFCDDGEWIERLADKRTGVKDPDVENIWKEMVYGSYVKPAISEGLLICGRPCFEGGRNGTVVNTLRFEDNRLVDLINRLLDVSSDSDSFRFDAVNIACWYMAYKFACLRDYFTFYYKKGALEDAEREAALMKTLLSDIDFLAAAEPEFRLDRWIEAAEAFGETPEEKACYARCARQIVSSRGFSNYLKDCGPRLWSGLISSYYAPRWEMWLDEVLDCMRTGREFSQEDMDRRLDEFERRWVEGLEPVPPATVPDDWQTTTLLLFDR